MMDLDAGQAALSSRRGLNAVALLTILLMGTMLAAALMGQINDLWLADPTLGARLLDGALYGAIVGSGVALALLSGLTAPKGTRHALTTATAAALAGAFVSIVVGSLGALFAVQGGGPGGVGLQLIGSVAFGTAVAGATRAMPRFGLSPDTKERPACCAVALGGAIGGFTFWLVANALRGVLSLSTFAYWETTTADALERLPGDSLGAGLPTLLIAAGVVLSDASHQAWQG